MNTKSARVIAIAWLLLINLTAFGQVTADFTANKTASCSPLIVRFTNQSTGNITSTKWFLGNGNTSYQVNPGAVYVQPGFKTVMLVVSDGVVSDTMIKPNYLQVYNDPEADIQASLTQGCTPFDVCFTDISIPGSAPIATWTWDFGDGSSSTDQNPCVTFSQPGSYNITLLVTDSNGCESQVVYPNMIEAHSDVVAGFTANVNSSCNPPLVVNFTSQSTSSSALNYYWLFGNGARSRIPNPTISFNSVGQYDVTLIAVNNFGCADTMSVPGYIAIEDLVADFSSNDSSGCVGTPIQFTDLSTSNPTYHIWDFGDGTTDTLANPVHVYNAVGTYTVKMVAYNSSTCIDSITKTSFITISDVPQAGFSGNDLTGCSFPHQVQFTDSSVGAVSWVWDFGDGDSSIAQNPLHAYDTAGVYTVSLTVTNANGCPNTFTIPDYVNLAAPEARFSADTVKGCAPVMVNFTDSSFSVQPIVSWAWDFGDGTTSTDPNPSHLYSNTGTYSVSLIIVNDEGCTDTLVRQDFIRTGTKPTADFGAGTTDICLFGSVAFVDQTQGNVNEWEWHFGDNITSIDQNPLYAYSDTGYFTVSLIAGDNGCYDTIAKPNFVHVNPPDARLSYIRDCTSPYAIQFQDISLAPDTWRWDFGDGDTSDQQNPVHTFASRGTYTVSLTVTDSSSGCYDIDGTDVIVTDPVADFHATDTVGCHPFTVSFDNTSIDGTISYWQSGGMTSADSIPTFTYTTPGVYDVSVIITDLHGCSDTLVRPNYITVLGPIAGFSATPTTGCAPLDVQFTDTSSSFMSTVTGWKWHFGDGDSSSLQNPLHRYDTTGTFSVTLDVTDGNGCTHSLTKVNYIKPTFPIPDFVGDSMSCVGGSVELFANSTGVGLTHFWDFGDGQTAATNNPVHFYDSIGTYTITLTVTDQNGCDSTIVVPDYVTIADPHANFFADSTFSPCPPLLVDFTDSSTADIVSWEWDFGDGSTSNLKNPSHVYLTPGHYDVTMIGYTAKGCADTSVKSDLVVVLGPSGTFDFTPTNGCLGNEVDFTAVTQNTASRTWDFGDGTVEPGGDTVMHMYTNSGVHYPSLILDDGQGCIFVVNSTDSAVVGELSADFGASDRYLCSSGQIYFTDSSQAYPAVTSRMWYFGDGGSRHVQNPLYTYTQPGVYDVMLVIHNDYCTDTMLKPAFIVVDGGPQADFGISNANGCVPQKVYFTDSTTSDSTIATYQWDFGNGLTDTVANPAVTYVDTGSYNVQLIVTSVSGCIDTIVKSLRVNPLPIISGTPDTSMCYSDTMQLNITGASYFNWYPSTGLSNDTIANPLASPPVNTTYTVLATDSNGCIARDTIELVVHQLPVPNAGPDREVCQGESVELVGSGGGSYNWSPDSTLTCTSCATTVATPETTTHYVLEVEDNFKCTDTDTVEVTVHELPVGLLNSDTAICDGESVQLNADGGTTYIWGPANNLSCNNCPDPVASPDTNTQYLVTTINQYNCQVLDTLAITVHPNPVVSITGDDNLCQGDTAKLIATGGTQYDWRGAPFMSCTTCADPLVSPDSSIVYDLTVTNSFGCTTDATYKISVRPIPTVSTIDDLTLCDGDDIVLQSQHTLGATFAWSPATGLSDSSVLSPIAAPQQTTTYTVKAYSQFGCEASDEVTINVINAVEVDLPDSAIVCYGEDVHLNGSIVAESHLGTQFVWNPINDITEWGVNPSFSPQRSTRYTMIAYSGSCKPDTNVVDITVHQLPVVTPTIVPPVVEGTEVTLGYTGPDNIVSQSWTPGYNLDCDNCVDPNLVASQSETYTLRVTDEFGCESEVEVPVTVVGACGDDLFVPNSFSPNNDGVNDMLYIRGRGITGLKDFRVFDRWGNMVFETKDFDKGWNGTYKGKALDQAVFVYYYEAICSNGFLVQRKGNVTLLR